MLTGNTSCSEDPDVKGTETKSISLISIFIFSCSEDPDVKGTETEGSWIKLAVRCGCSEDPDVKGTETAFVVERVTELLLLQRGSRCKGN